MNLYSLFKKISLLSILFTPFIFTSCSKENCVSSTEIIPPTEGDDNNDTEDDKPIDLTHYNVLFIMADDFNYWANCVGYYPISITPNIDRLASEGVLFTNTFCSSPVSNPSRNAMWSGFRPSTTGIDSNSSGFFRDVAGFENVVSMNQYFKNNNYYVYGAGKLYHPSQMSKSDKQVDPENWSEINECSTGSKASGGNVVAWENPNWTQMIYHIGKNPLSKDDDNDYSMALDVAKFIESYSSSNHKDKPFFIGCGFFRPHLPWNISSDFYDKYNNVNISIPAGYRDNDLDDLNDKNISAHQAVVDNGKWGESIKAYLSCLTHADYCVGILLNALEKTKYKENTIIVFMGDHGWQLGEKCKWGKNTVYNAANRTTFVIYNPSSSNKNNHKCTCPISMQDIYPTLVSLCNLPQNIDIEGNNFSELIDNPLTTSWDKPVMATYNGTSYIQDKNYKLVSSTSNPQLYDIKNDPYEFNNLYNNTNSKDIISKYETKMDSILKIGEQLKKKMGITRSVSSSVNAFHLGLQYPKKIREYWANNYFINRGCIKNINNNKIFLDLISTSCDVRIYLYDCMGNLIDKSSAIGEMNSIYTPKIQLTKGEYFLLIDDDLYASIENFSFF